MKNKIDDICGGKF